MTKSILHRSGADHSVVLIGYGLLFASVFTLGATGVAAVLLAYAARGQVAPELGKHLTGQIRTFWIALLLGVAGLVACLVGAGIFVSDVFSHHGEWPSQPVLETAAELVKIYRYNLMSPVLIGSGIVVMLLSALISLLTPAIGFLRLATTEHQGVTPKA